eukprot:Em0015g254a
MSSATELARDAPVENNDTVDSASVSKCTLDDASSLASTSFINCDERRAERSEADESTVPRPDLDGSNGDSSPRDAQAINDGHSPESSSIASSDSVCLKAGPDNGSAVPGDEPGSAAGERSAPSSRVELRPEQQRDSERRTPQCSRVQAVVNVPKHLVGRFIGKQGRNVKALRAESGGAYIYVDQSAAGESPFVPCFVHGEPAQVEEALRLISYKYPNITVPSDYSGGARSLWPGDEVSSGYDSSSPISQNGVRDYPTNPWATCLARSAPPPSPFHAMVTYIETLKKVWVLPLDATHHLEELHKGMNSSYSHVPPLPQTFPQANVGTFCAVGIDGSHWLRGVVLQMNPAGQTCDVRLVDYGSCVVVAVSALRPLRAQDTEAKIRAFPCLLANIADVSAEGTRQEEAMTVLQALVENTVMEVHVMGVEVEERAEQLPTVELYAQYSSWAPTFINRELVDQGFAVWEEKSA